MSASTECCSHVRQCGIPNRMRSNVGLVLDRMKLGCQQVRLFAAEALQRGIV